MPLLEVNDLVVDFGRHRRVAVDHVSWSLEAGERLGLIGEVWVGQIRHSPGDHGPAAWQRARVWLGALAR